MSWYKKSKSNQKNVLLAFITVTSFVSLLSYDHAFAAVPRLVFPVIGNSSYSNDFNAPRSNNTIHHATDIIANKGQKIVSATDGVIQHVWYPQPAWGYMISIKDSAGYTYNYIHINNDTPGTDDGRGGGMNAYAPDMKQGNVVKKGQLLGYVGDSGNAEGTVSHLHFEIYNGDTAINPYSYLNAAQRISTSVRYPQLSGEFLPYGVDGVFGTNVADGNFNADINRELVTGVGAGAPPHVLIFDKNNVRIGSMFAYSTAFRGGVDVAAANMDLDSDDEVITAAGKGGGPQIKVFKKTGAAIGSFFAYPTSERTGVSVSVGDVDGDNVNEIVTVRLKGGEPLVRVFEADGQMINEFYAYDQAYTGGLDVAVGDVNGDNIDDIVTSPLSSGRPHVRVFTRAGVLQSEFYAFNKDFLGGVRVDVGNADASTPIEEIGVAPASKGGPHAKLLNRLGSTLDESTFLEEWWRGSYAIAVGPNFKKAAVGTDRRFSVRQAF